MKFSTDISEIAKALSAAQGEFVTLRKDKANPFFKSLYNDLADHVEMIRAILPKHGLAYTQGTEEVNGKEKLATMILHASGQWIISYSPWYAMEDVERDKKTGEIIRTFVKPQSAGSGSTYSRRYGLAAAFGIVSANEDDDGNIANGNKVERKHLPKTAPTRPPESNEEFDDI